MCGFFSKGNEIQMQGLKSWNNSSVPMATYSVDEFRAFLPYPVLEPPLGQPWHIVESRIDKDGTMCQFLF